MFKSLLILATCSTVTVLGTSTVDGSDGEYFEFSAEELSNMVGYVDWHSNEFEIVQSGSQSWEGKVTFWKDGNTSFGKKATGNLLKMIGK